MSREEKESLKNPKQPVKLGRVWIPVTISVIVSAYLIYSNFSVKSFAKLSFSATVLVGLFIALATVMMRDAAYMYRIRLLTGNKLSWWVSLQVILLWEFGSAITPGAVGGIALALFILRKEGISYGQTTATIILATILDNLAFIIVFSLLLLIYGNSMFSVSTFCPDLEGHFILQGLQSLSKGAWIIYFLQIGITMLLSFGLFVNPQKAKNIFFKLSEKKLLSRFEKKLKQLGEDLVTTSLTFLHQPKTFWLKAIAITIITWVSRYALVNGLVIAFSGETFSQLEVFARQYVLWTFLLLPSTPGASGLAELSFIAMNCEFFPEGTSAFVATIWRMFNYYIYIILGIVVLPRWLKRVN